MSDELQTDDFDQNFWDDVDALRAMLEEEDSGDSRPQSPAFHINREPHTAGSQQPAPTQFQRQQPARMSGQVTEGRNPSRQNVHPQGHPMKRKVRVPRRPSKGALITLYTILVLELGAIAAVAYRWYSWIH